MTGPIAALPMYDWPEVRAETDRLWASIRDGLRDAGVAAPEALTRDGDDLDGLWRDPDLLLAQTCWGPMEQGLAGHVTVVAQPDYSAFEGGAGAFYSSAILMQEALPSPLWGGSIGEAERGGGKASTLQTPTPSLRADPPHRGEGKGVGGLVEQLKGARFAFNSRDSMSGLISVERDLAAAGEGLGVFGEMVETGSHRASIVAVAEGRADVCAVDCRTWDLAKRFEPAARGLRVVGWTGRRLGLPLITSQRTTPETLGALQHALVRAGVVAGG